MSRELTIQGHSFTVNPPYAAGHTLNDNEALTLNQTWCENIRNNTAGIVKKAMEDAEKSGVEMDLSAVAAEIAKYADGYEFHVRAGGVRTPADPVGKKTFELIVAKVKEGILKKGYKLKDYGKEIKEFALSVYEDEEKAAPFRSEAERQVNAAAGIDLGDFLS